MRGRRGSEKRKKKTTKEAIMRNKEIKNVTTKPGEKQKGVETLYCAVFRRLFLFLFLYFYIENCNSRGFPREKRKAGKSNF